MTNEADIIKKENIKLNNEDQKLKKENDELLIKLEQTSLDLKKTKLRDYSLDRALLY